MTIVQKCIDDEDFDRRTVDIVDSGAIDQSQGFGMAAWYI
jgi:hypothetical protein